MSEWIGRSRISSIASSFFAQNLKQRVELEQTRGGPATPDSALSGLALGAGFAYFGALTWTPGLRDNFPGGQAE
jgi:hypothetical protein